ncbi:hypothetical protein [Kitasatospora kifunensis]|uniref:Uncharacterized protein n=1 Tax=Kitasatospora kifunensis TaxID=58351 RepID=A0A7W7VVZ9_KITKI|nr:hypothetical protein [Kitasatospora kifunensis]MBB4924194.1 hypothetical protein [Kitasatospora kifunensis]
MYTEPSARSDFRGESEDASEADPAADHHQIEISERGSFAHAGCDCGWFAPARRSRDRARRDAAEHRAAAGG